MSSPDCLVDYQKKCAKYYFQQTAREHVKKSVENNIADLFSSSVEVSRNNDNDVLSKIRSIEKVLETCYQLEDEDGMMVDCFSENKDNLLEMGTKSISS